MKRAIGGGKSSTVVVVAPLEDTLQQHQQQPPPSSQQRQSLSSSSSFISPITTTTSMANTNHTTMMNPPSSSTSTASTTYNNNNFNVRRFVYQQYHYHLKSLNGKKIISSTVFTLMLLLIIDSLWSSPNERIVPPNFANDFLLWVQDHPGSGLIWILLLMSISVICMIPIGTPLTLGCGYIYKGAYGWQFGIFIATCVSMMGSALGAIICFLLGRYLMRDMVKKWIRKYPIFDAIDIAAAEHGLRIMAMLYLTPILPLGPVSYMCGTTSLKLSHFILAKIAALPLMMLYVLIGASTGTLISTTSSNSNNNSNNMDTAADPAQSIEHNQTLIISGIVLSFASIAGITHYIKKELNQILERQKRELEHNGTSNNSSSSSGTGNNGIEFSHMSPVTTSTTPSKDIESGTATTSSSTSSTFENNFIHILENDLVTTTTPSSTVASTSIATTSIPSSSSTTTIPTLLVDDSNVHLSSTTTNTAPRQRKH